MQNAATLRRRANAGSWTARPDLSHVRTGAVPAHVTRFDVRVRAAGATAPAECHVAAQVQGGACCDGEALLALLLGSIERGHWRVALKRYLMLLACDVPVPACYEIECRRYAAQCSEQSLDKMRAHVRRWAAMLGATDVERIDFAVQSASLPRDRYEQLHAAFRPLE